jgi:hypothetical protein
MWVAFTSQRSCLYLAFLELEFKIQNFIYMNTLEFLGLCPLETLLGEQQILILHGKEMLSNHRLQVPMTFRIDVGNGFKSVQSN